MIILTSEQRDKITLALLASRASPSTEVREAANAHINAAIELVGAYIDGHETKVPDNLLTTAILTVARELETRAKSPGGVFAAFGETDTPIRLARDPLITVYPLLNRFIGGGFA